MKLSIVIAAYDELANVEPLTRRLHQAVAAIAGCERELLFVVEGEDGTLQALERLQQEIPGIRILYQKERSGLGAAFRRGFAAIAADADFVITMDADLNHQPEEIPRLLAAARRRGCDVLIGSRAVAGSRVEGTPLWKRAASGLLNVVMGRLLGVRVRDKTSGFRIYRAAVLGRLRYDNDQFAFLPELLVRARQAGYDIAEEPIHFRYRIAGRSKMAFLATSLSYLELLKKGCGRAGWMVAALLLSGAALRVAVAYPSHKYGGDADCAMNAICALRILHGHHPVFFSSMRIGSLGAHLTALCFLLFGVNRDALAAEPVVFGVLTLCVWYLLLREVLGRRLALIGLPFAAVLSPAVSFWTYQPNGYPELMLLCATVLWLAVRSARAGASGWTLFAFGLAAGLGWWHSLQTLQCTLPAVLWLLWLLWRRRLLLARRRLVLLAAGGFLLGAFPWIAFNVHHRLASLRSNYAARPASGVSAVFASVRNLTTYELPELVAADPKNAASPPLPPWLHWATLGVVAAAALYFFVSRAPAAWRALRPRTGRRPPRLASAWVLFALVAGAVTSLFAASEVGSLGGMTVRYILPLYLLVPGLLAVLLARLGRLWRPLPWALGAALVCLYLGGATLPGTAARRIWAANKLSDERLLAELDRQHVDAVTGSFWTVYPLRFLSRERLGAVPLDDDPQHLGPEFLGTPAPPPRWAVVAHHRDGLQRWAEDAQIAGTLATVDSFYTILLPLPNPPREPARDFALQAWRATMTQASIQRLK
jgi:dolichol-phosphate mannosyltransferase